MKLSTVLTIAAIIAVLGYLGDGEMESHQMIAEKHAAVSNTASHAAYASGVRFNSH